MKELNNASDIVNNPTALYNQVEAIQESAAIIIPGAAKTVKTIHHCFTDLSRERIVGVNGLRQYAPFKEVAADHMVAPLQPPTTRDSSANRIPSFSDFLQTGKENGIINSTCSSGETVEKLETKASNLWISGDHLQRFYGKARKAGKVAAAILESIPEEMSEEEKDTKENEFYDQLLFLWSIEKGYAASVALKDPPDSDPIQDAVEEINDLLVEGRQLEKDGQNSPPPGLPDRPPPGDTDLETGMRGRGGERDNRNRRRSQSRSRRAHYHSSSDDSERGRDKRSRSRDRGRSPQSRSRDRPRGRRRSNSERRERQHDDRERDRNNQGVRFHRSRTPRRSRSRSPARRRSSESHDNSRFKSQEDPLTAVLIQGITALTKSQLEIAERERRKKSVLSRLSQRQVFLFDALSARSWNDPNPLKTREAEMMLEDCDVERNWNLLVDMTDKWPGSISKPAFIQFLTKGFVSQERPGGFTVFMFGPPKKMTVGKKDRKRNLRNVLGKRGEFDEEDLDFYAKNEFFLPKSVYEAEGQLLMAVQTLDLFTHHKSIASDGYRYGLEFLDERRNIFHDRQEKDEMFMARYLNLLDNTFQSFASKLGTFHEYRDPIREARHSLRKRMEKDIDRIMRDIDYDVFPRLALPPRLTEQGHDDSGSRKQRAKEKSPSTSNNRANPEETDASEALTWWKKNPSPDPEWALPSGKAFKDFFDTTKPTGRANLARMPKAKHHSSKVRLRRNICAKYQCEGECRTTCNLTHMPPNKMNDDIRQEVKDAFKAAYNS